MRAKSFTLIELLVVIAIVGILAGILILSMTNATDQATIAKAKVFSSSMRNSMANSIISEWKFEGPTNPEETATAQDVQDSWGNNNSNIILYGTPKIKATNECVIGKCIFFNGTTDYITLGTGGANLQTYTNLSLEFWVNSNASKSQAVMAQWTPWIVFITNNKSRLYIKDTTGADISTSSETQIPTNKWSHVAITFDRTNNKAIYYLNGKEDGIKYFANSIAPSTNQRFQLGGYAYVSTFFSGKIDELRIYDSAITISQIKQRYLAGLHQLFAKNLITKKYLDSRITELEYKNATKQ